MRLRRTRVDELQDIHKQSDNYRVDKQRNLDEVRVREVTLLNDFEIEAMDGEHHLQANMVNLKKMLEGSELRSKTPGSDLRSGDSYKYHLENLKQRHERQKTMDMKAQDTKFSFALRKGLEGGKNPV